MKEKGQERRPTSIRKLLYGLYTCYIPHLTSLAPGWRRLTYDELTTGRVGGANICGRNGCKVLKAIGDEEVFHVDGGRVGGWGHGVDGRGGRVECGTAFDTFGLRRRFEEEERQRRELEEDGDASVSTASTSTASTSTTTMSSSMLLNNSAKASKRSLAQKRQQHLDGFNNVGWVLVVPITSDNYNNNNNNNNNNNKTSVKCATIAPPKKRREITWKNVGAIQKLTESRCAIPKGPGAYKVTYSAIESGPKGAPRFEAGIKSRKKTQGEIRSNPRLNERKAEEVIAEESRAQFLESQLPQEWIQEDGDGGTDRLRKSGVGGKGVFKYRDPTPLPKQAEEKIKERMEQQAARDNFLPTQLPDEWHKDTKERYGDRKSQPIHKTIGRDSVVVRETVDGEREVLRVAFTDMHGDLKSPTADARGPGLYDPYKFEEKEDDDGRDTMGKVTGRDERAGPFGERPEEAVRAEEEVFGGREGDRLLIDPDSAKDRLRESVRNVVFDKAGADDGIGEEEEEEMYFEGQNVILDIPDGIDRYGKKRENTVVNMSKMQNARADDDIIGEDDGRQGDNLILEVEEAIRNNETGIRNVVFDKAAIGGGEGAADPDGDKLILDPRLTPTREQAHGKNYAYLYDKMGGRDDVGAEDELLLLNDPDAHDLARAEVERAWEGEEMVARAHTDAIVSQRRRSVSLVNFGRDHTERFKDDVKEKGGDALELELDGWEKVKEKKNFNLVDMSRMEGRGGEKDLSDEYDLDVQGDNLILRPEIGEKLIRHNQPMVGKSVSKQPERWDDSTRAGESEGGGEDVVVGSDVTRYGKEREKSTVRMGTQVGRGEEYPSLAGRKGGMDMVDDVGIPLPAPGEIRDGDIVDVTVNKSPTEPRRGKGAPKIVLGEKERKEIEVRRRLMAHREKRRKREDERKERGRKGEEGNERAEVDEKKRLSKLSDGKCKDEEGNERVEADEEKGLSKLSDGKCKDSKPGGREGGNERREKSILRKDHIEKVKRGIKVDGDDDVGRGGNDGKNTENGGKEKKYNVTGEKAKHQESRNELQEIETKAKETGKYRTKPVRKSVGKKKARGKGRGKSTERIPTELMERVTIHETQEQMVVVDRDDDKRNLTRIIFKL